MAFRLKFSSRALREIGEDQEWYELQNADLSFPGFLTACFMRYGVISYMFWPCCMMLAIRDAGLKPKHGVSAKQSNIAVLTLHSRGTGR